MKQTYPFFIMLLVGLLACKSPQREVDTEAPKRLTGHIQTDLNLLLPEGNITVDRMSGVKRDMRLAELQTKYQKGVQAHYDWYVSYIQDFKIGEPIPYHPSFGLSSEEYEERQKRIDAITYYSEGLDKVDIIKDQEKIQFKTSKKLSDFENVRFNLKNNTVNVGDYVLHFADSVNIESTKNGFRSKWKGYVWSYAEPSDIHLEALENVQGLDIVQYKVSVGLLEDGRSLLQLEATEIEDGIVLLEKNVPLLL